MRYMSNFREMTKNYVFREYECGLTIEETARLCFKSVITVKSWDKGKPIPPECKRLMRMSKGRELSHSEEWERFRMNKNRMELPTGENVTPQQILTGIALLELGAEPDLVIASRLMRYVRALTDIKKGR